MGRILLICAVVFGLSFIVAVVVGKMIAFGNRPQPPRVPTASRNGPASAATPRRPTRSEPWGRP